MYSVREEIGRNLKYLRVLAEKHPNMQNVCTEIINLRAILNLPKGTEHFLSDLHGEHEAFAHILNNGSGVIREKVEFLFGSTLSPKEISRLCTLIYYPEQKLRQLKEQDEDLSGWYEANLLRLLDVCRLIASKYTRSKVRKAMPPAFAYILDELLHADYDADNLSIYYEKIMESILALDNADAFIAALASLIKNLAVDRLHIVGDIFDRGPRPDRILDMLEQHHSVDLQWGNHDVLWMGAAAGSTACMMATIFNSLSYGNVVLLEQGYGISLRALAHFAQNTYGDCPVFAPKQTAGGACGTSQKLLAKMRKAASVLMFKLEGQLILRHPEYGMQDRLLLDKIDAQTQTVEIKGEPYPMRDCHLPTLSAGKPYALTPEEEALVEELKVSFQSSERLARHVQFLFTYGNMYTCFNQNLLFHGCIPMEEDGSFSYMEIGGSRVCGRELMDAADALARQSYYGEGEAKRAGLDWMWYLWCGKHSPLFGRACCTTFERLFVEDKATWQEAQNPYYRYAQQEKHCLRIIQEFGLNPAVAHIINGHVPVRACQGESPIKAQGRRIAIDGGFCKAYQPQTGIAGYTLIYNSYGMRLSAHRPFHSVADAVQNNTDIHSVTNVFETMQYRMKVMDTDIGQEISEQIYGLSLLLNAYRAGILRQNSPHPKKG